jgi:hypothetical protein
MSNVQNFTASLIQGDTSVTFEISTDKKLTTSRIAGTLANEIALYMDVMKSGNCKRVFKFNKPFTVIFKSDKDVIFDSQKLGNVSTEFKDTMKLLNNPQSKKRFCSHLFNTLTWAERSGQLTEMAEFMTYCNEQLAIKNELKAIEAAK